MLKSSNNHFGHHRLRWHRKWQARLQGDKTMFGLIFKRGFSSSLLFPLRWRNVDWFWLVKNIQKSFHVSWGVSFWFPLPNINHSGWWWKIEVDFFYRPWGRLPCLTLWKLQRRRKPTPAEQPQLGFRHDSADCKSENQESQAKCQDRGGQGGSEHIHIGIN